MTIEQPNAPLADLAPDPVEFAPWPTLVENDDLLLGRLTFDVGSPLATSVREGLSYALPPSPQPQSRDLEASFISTARGTIIRFGFSDVIAFRVLDENGLIQLWEASRATPRPAQTTFRATGHAWSRESMIAFLGEGAKARFSYFVATNEWCLEVICNAEPEVVEIGPAIIARAEANGS